MKISGRLNPAHPTGTYRRAGFVFNKTTKTIIDTAKLTDEQEKALRTDAWLSFEAFREPEPEAP